ncbi:polyketide cyclase [Streptomyces pluripotens]|uniref:Polyketide cyclase n=1 Tax=Streptomyces pluripotens TaxID=1355015 RepID=A0A221NTX4_9ACTN|nr:MULTISPECIES: SRPBCC family protein [Streptomyces]ARP69139.1 polyketide cyclase [Streptomyces pluripotens]ASN23400.1 polyketide cyclase [Streptomyces pluripotens]KIE25661.1 polyketide cyclase [Streptomyces sp. MUSC 125]MCH0559053.1 SRPBCC family protein [Streptomyces sp. MUM 16J]
MAEVSAEARIQAPAERVWAQLTDWTSYREWNTTHTGFPQGGPENLAAGGTFRENMKLMGFPAEVDWTVEELEPARVLAIRGKGPMAVTVATRYTLTPDGDATTVRIDGEFTGAAVSLMAGKLKDSATAALHESLRRLSGLVA